MRKEGIGATALILTLAVVLLVVLPAVSAEIFISQPESMYNINDNINVSITLLPNVDSTDFFSSKLVCPQGELEIYKSIETLNANQQKTILFSAVLNKQFLGELMGNCFIRASYSGDVVESQNFDITSNVKVSVEVNGVVFGPNDNVAVSGTAVKENGNPLNGFVETNIDGLNLTVYGEVIEGKFNFNFSIPGNAAAQTYDLNVVAYEKKQDQVINEGKASSIVKVEQVIQEARVEVSSQTINPGEEIKYTVRLYDQAGNEASEDIGLTLYLPDKNVFSKKLVKSGTENVLKTETNYSAGYWKVEGKLGEIQGDKIFYINELQKASFVIVNNTLIVTNLGNVPYTKPVEVKIGDKVEIKELGLGVGETKKLKISAPEGEHAVTINDGEKSEEIVMVFGTARAIDLGNIGESLNENLVSIVWVVIILILAVVALYYYNKVRKKNFVGKEPRHSGVINVSAGDKSSGSEQGKVLLDQGKKEEEYIVSLKIKNL